jgi:dTDP-4-dehydrorhamnose reductase
MRLLVTGGQGQAAAEAGDVVIGHGARPAMDLLRRKTIAPAMAAFAPDVVVDAAAYTAVDRAGAGLRGQPRRRGRLPPRRRSGSR